MIPHPGVAQACPQGIGRAISRILIVGDDPAIRFLIGRALAAAGYVTDLASTGTQGLRRVPEPHYELIILDLVTTDLDSPPARGGFQVREETQPHGEVIRVGQLSLDLGRLTADTGHGPIPLTRLEFLLLRELAEHAGQPVPKSKLLSTVWGYEFDPGSNVVDVCVRRLRSKLGFDLIKTVRGEGYQLAGQLPRPAVRQQLRAPPAPHPAGAAASREPIEDDPALTAAVQAPIDRPDAEVRERARSDRARRLGYPGLRAKSRRRISARHGGVNAMPADCRMPW
jgi:DNA-binding response OmpR family regulator